MEFTNHYRTPLEIPTGQMVSYQWWSDPRGPEKSFQDKKGFYKKYNRKLSFMSHNKNIHDSSIFWQFHCLKLLHFYK